MTIKEKIRKLEMVMTQSDIKKEFSTIKFARELRQERLKEIVTKDIIMR